MGYDPEYHEAYYKHNRDAILARKKVKVECEKCHKSVLKIYLKRHQKTGLCERSAEQYNKIEINIDT